MRRFAVVPVVLSVLFALAPAHAAERVYTIDANASDIHWLVYRAGSLSRFGHNHVITAANVQGKVTLDTEDASASRFEMSFPVADLVVDDPELRKGLGEEFSSVPSPQDVEGTKSNMLGDRVLDGAKFPVISIAGVGPFGSGAEQTLKLQVHMLGRTIDLTVPTTVVVGEQEVKARGEFELEHADLGMQPFTVMLGALSVGEKISFFYDVTARAAR